MSVLINDIINHVTGDIVDSIFNSSEISIFMSNNKIVDLDYCDFEVESFELNEASNEFTFEGTVTIEGTQEGGRTGVDSCCVGFSGRVSCEGILLEPISITSLE